jgi:subtilisin-like proprotein convertase family protein
MNLSKLTRIVPDQLTPMLLAIVMLAIAFAFAESASAQSEWVRRIDANSNGYLEPNEVSDRARSFLGRFAGEYGIDLNSTNSVRRVEEAARQYFERRNREATENTPPVVTSTIKGFGPDPDSYVIPDFTTPEIKYPYTPADLTEADEALGRFDRNRDGVLTFDEIDPNRWRGPSPQACDLDNDSRLSRIELAQRYARRKQLEKQEAFTNQFAASQAPPAEESRSDRWRRDVDTYERGPRGTARADRGNRALAFSILERFDLNRNQLLEPAEMSRVGVDIVKADFNRDGRVDGEELGNYFFQEMEREGNDLAEVLPTWFFERDENNDGQIEMAEFTDEWTPDKTDEFAKFDSNEDGIITSTEALSSKQIVGGKYANTEAKVMLPRSIVVSEIQVDEDVIIGDLNLQLSITHSNVEQLDGYLIGPEGQRIELFAGIGGGDDHFDRTVFDDEVWESVMRARPPFRGTYQPAALAKRQPSLNSFKGKSLKGLWQLMVRSSRSDRSGVLHDWSLIVTPNRDSVDQLLDN